MSELPWMKFFPASWLADVQLKSCSAAAQGLWISMICIMHGARPVGHLVVNDKPIGDAVLAQQTGIPQRDVRKLLTELEANGVFSRNEHGVIFSRKMVRDAERAARSKANGKTGGNPKLKGPDNPGSVQSGITPGITQPGGGLGYPYYPLPLQEEVTPEVEGCRGGVALKGHPFSSGVRQ